MDTQKYSYLSCAEFQSNMGNLNKKFQCSQRPPYSGLNRISIEYLLDPL